LTAQKGDAETGPPFIDFFVQIRLALHATLPRSPVAGEARMARNNRISAIILTA
jgi:hypothetical protein